MDTEQLINYQVEQKRLDRTRLEAQMYAMLKRHGMTLTPFEMEMFASARGFSCLAMYMYKGGYSCEAHYLDSYEALIARAGMALLTKQQLYELLVSCGAEVKRSWRRVRMVHAAWQLPVKERLNKLGYRRADVSK